MSKWRDYYRILGVRRDATQGEIKEAWIFGAKAFHPDKFAGSSQRQQAVAQERTKAVNEAFYVLSDATRRADYDREYTRKTRAETTPPPRPHSAAPPPPRTTASSSDSRPPEDQASSGSPGEQNPNESFSTVLYGAGLYIAWLIAAAMVVSAAVERHPYSFYMLLRWVCCGIFAYSAFAAHERSRPLWIWVFGALAALYNPIFPVRLDRSAWIGVNWFTVGAIIVAAVVFVPGRGRIWIAAATGLVVITVGLWQLQPVTRLQTSGSSASPAEPEIRKAIPVPQADLGAAAFAKYAKSLREEEMSKIEPPALTPTNSPPATQRFPLKTNVVTTVFWIGGPKETDGSVRTASAWDSNWIQNYGGVDDPDPPGRRSYLPIAFIPRQNPFYCALPYDDVTHGQFKPEAPLVIPWFKQSYTGPGQSVCWHRWLAIRKGDRTCYAEWEDCGPFLTDHFQYVFGNERPKPNLNHGAGLDVSPAVRDYLGLAPTDVTDWQFVEVRDVPPGPWRSYGENNHFVIARRQDEQRMEQNSRQNDQSPKN